MNKVLYIMRYSIDQEFNLKGKFDGQLVALKNLGYEVYYIGFDSQYLYLMHNGEKEIYGKTHYKVPTYLHTLFYRDLHRACIKAIKENGIDIIYWRAAPIFASSYKLAEVAKKMKSTVIVEESTFPPDAQKDGIKKLFYLYSNQFDKRFSETVDMYVAIGEDAGGEYKGKPAINIDNGIDVNSVHVRKPVNEKDTIHILALASMCYWHGYDRLIKSLAEYKGNQKVIIHMVGGNDGGCLPEWKDLTHRLNLDDKVIFHGQMSGKELDEMFDLCDIGINALAMYKKNFSVTMELKSREYIARGLPFVCTVNDPILNNTNGHWWMRIPNDSSIPNMNDIIVFATRMKKETYHIREMRELAVNCLTWEEQYNKVFDKLKGLKE